MQTNEARQVGGRTFGNQDRIEAVQEGGKTERRQDRLCRKGCMQDRKCRIGYRAGHEGVRQDRGEGGIGLERCKTGGLKDKRNEGQKRDTE